MISRLAFLMTLHFVFCVGAQTQDHAPLKLVRTFEIPAEVTGSFDHMAADTKGHRVFASAEDYKAVLVFDYQSGKLIHTITGIDRPHSILYREDVDRIYVTDGVAGGLKVFEGKSYHLVKFIPLRKRADSIGYDPATKYVYVVNGGDSRPPGNYPDAQVYVTAVDTTKEEKVAEIGVGGNTVEGIRVESSGPRMFVNNTGKNVVHVIDRTTLRIIVDWPVTLATLPSPMALDEQHHRLFLASHNRTGQIDNGKIVVIDTETGKELQALPLDAGVDDMFFDPATQRIYAICGGDTKATSGGGVEKGFVDVYEERDPDHYVSLGKFPSGYFASNGVLVPKADRIFVSVPKRGAANAAIFEYSVQ
jgi:DNA-binding beta-propeller fold protein YncE